jgi:hypothetical protein
LSSGQAGQQAMAQRLGAVRQKAEADYQAERKIAEVEAHRGGERCRPY